MPIASEEGRTRHWVELQQRPLPKAWTATASRVALREAMCDYVVTEMARDTSPATILRFVASALRAAEKGADGVAEELAQLLIDWCAEFRPRPARSLPETA